MDTINLGQLVFAVSSSTVGVVAFVFMTFATQRDIEKIELDIQRHKTEIDKRLERIETKIYRLIDKANH